MAFKELKELEVDSIDEFIIKEIRSKIIDWGKRNFVSFPWRLTENKFHALLAEMMLQRTKAEQVKPVYQLFVKNYPTLDIALMSRREILTLLRSLGLRWRALKIIELIEELHRIEGKIPNNRENLMNLPGIGEYIAAVFLSCHLGIRASIVDSNVVRLYGRIFGFSTSNDTRRKKNFQKLANRMTPLEGHKMFNYALLDFTRMVCKSRPLCIDCPLKNICVFNRKDEKINNQNLKLKSKSIK